MVIFDANSWTLTDQVAQTHRVWPCVFWYLAPTTTSPSDKTHPLHLALTLHNAKLGEGISPSPSSLLSGISLTTTKTGTPGEAERFFEDVRMREFRHLPSRLRSYFLSLNEMSARHRADNWNWRDRLLTPCYLINPQRCHFADVRDYEIAARDGPTDKLARSYWQAYDPEITTIDVTEVLADCALYFPDWRQFPELDRAALAKWDLERTKKT